MERQTSTKRCATRLGGWFLAGAIAVAGVLLWPVQAQAQPPPPIDVDITADNAYGFGYGTATGISSYQGNIQNCDAGQIFNCGAGPEAYTVSPTTTDTHLYIVAWADDSVSQGVLAQFKSGTNTIYSGLGNWEVCASGRDVDPQCGGSGQAPPTNAQINAQILTCNAPTSGGYSQGWVGQKPLNSGNKLVFGEDNSTQASGFPIACQTGTGTTGGIDTQAKWMWYDGTPNGVATPFNYNDNPNGDYLIFRLPLNDVYCAATFTQTKVECVSGPPDPSGCYTITTTITNNTGQPLSYVMLPSTGTTPNVIPLNPPLPSSPNPLNTRAITFTYCPPLSSTATTATIDVSLAGANGAPCCKTTLKVDLPPCPKPDCLWVPRYGTSCIPGAPPGTFNLWFTYRNMTNCPTSLFLIPNPPSAASPSYFAGAFTPFTGSGPNWAVGTSGNPIKITGATSSTVCMIISPQCKQGGNCCSRRVCFPVPNCWPNPLPTPTLDLTPLEIGVGAGEGQ